MVLDHLDRDQDRAVTAHIDGAACPNPGRGGGWGVANMSDPPLSAGGGDAPAATAVVPEKALRAARKTASKGGGGS